MELNLARIVYEPVKPPPDTVPVLVRTQINLPDAFATPGGQNELTALEESMSRQGYMVQVLA